MRLALVQEFARPLPEGAALAALLKALPVRHLRAATAGRGDLDRGGVAWDGLDAGLMLTALPGVFVAGEMLDWDAPTGGYLLTGCLATGRHAGRAAGGLGSARGGAQVARAARSARRCNRPAAAPTWHFRRLSPRPRNAPR